MFDATQEEKDTAARLMNSEHAYIKARYGYLTDTSALSAVRRGWDRLSALLVMCIATLPLSTGTQSQGRVQRVITC